MCRPDKENRLDDVDNNTQDQSNAPDPTASDWSAPSSGRFVPFLSHITDGCNVMDLNPSSCIPLYLTRDHSPNAVMRLVAIITGDAHEAVGLSGMVSGTPTSVVVPLVGELEFIIEEYLSKKHKDPVDRAFVIKQHETWYGIIDGNHFYCALMEVRKKYPIKWSHVQWKVFCVRPVHTLDEYRKLAVVQNERNRQAYHYEPTLSGMLKGLRRIYDNLFDARVKTSRTGRRGVSVHHRDVAHVYDGGDHDRNTTVRQAVSVATRLSLETLDAIDEMSNLTCEDIILANSELNDRNAKTVKSVMSTYDCRLFKRFLCTSTLRGARLFMNAAREGDHDAQINSIYRCRHWSEVNNFRSVKPSVLNEQFQLAKLAIEEQRKFLTLLACDEWPADMGTIRENVLRTTVCDKDLTSNQGNATDVLPILWKSFKRVYPGRAKGIELAQKEKEERDKRGQDTSSETPPTPPTPPSEDQPEGSSSNSEENLKRSEEEEKRKEIEQQMKLRASADEHLKEIGISIHEISFEDFLKDVWTTRSKRADLILSVAPSEVDSETVSEKLPLFCKSVLKTGGYIFLIVSNADYRLFHKSFCAAGFKVSDSYFSIVYDTATIRRRKTKDFPLGHCDIALVARAKGRHPSGFLPQFLQTDGLEDSSVSTFASFLNVENCGNKLKRPDGNSAIFPCERSVQLFSRVIRAFTPSEGSVMDPFAGPLTSSIACMETGRTCISMSDHGTSTKYAIGRLRIFATPNATMEHLGAYTEPLPSSSASDNPSTKKRRTECESAPTTGSEQSHVGGLRQGGEDDNHIVNNARSRTTRSSRQIHSSQQAPLTAKASTKTSEKPSAKPIATPSEPESETVPEQQVADVQHTSCDLVGAKDLLSLHHSRAAGPHEENGTDMVNKHQQDDQIQEYEEYEDLPINSGEENVSVAPNKN